MVWRRDVLERIQPQDPYKDGRPAVWPEDPDTDVDYVVVGEAPGKNEVREGKPFVGRSGKLLREVITDVALGRIHFTNASYYRPTSDAGDAPPAAKIIQAERPRLLLEVSMCKPKAIVTVGVTAAYALLGNVPRMRGMVKELEIHGQRYPVYITHHPAYILYEPDRYRDLVEDFRRARNLEVPERDFGTELQEGPERFAESAEEIALDIEADSTYPGTAQILVACAYVTYRGGPGEAYYYAPDALHRLDGALRSFQGRVVGHNSSFDEVLLRRAGVSVSFNSDTLLRHYSQDERKGSHKLKSLGPTLARADTGIERIWAYTHAGAGGVDRRSGDGEDDERGASRTRGWESIPADVLRQYCARDAAVTSKLHARLGERATTRSEGVYSFLLRANRAFVSGVGTGVAIDTGRLRDALGAQEQRVTEFAAEFGFNPESHPQTVLALQSAGYRIRSAAREILNDLEGELPGKLLEFREHNKLLKGFLRPLLEWTKETDSVYPTYKLFGTDSGRTSCANPNLQQVPASLKHLFIARPGNVFVGWDFRVHEVRGIAYLSQDERLIEILRDPDADPHQLIADLVGLERSVAKRAVFAVAYGAGAGRLVRTGVESDTARRAVEAIRDLFPGLESWRRAVIERVYSDGYVETPYYGRRRHFDYMDDRTAHHQERVAVNFLPQSLCGDVALDSAVSVYEELGFPPLIFVHDFNLIEVPEEKASAVAEACKEIAGSILPNPHVRFIPDVKIGPNWGDLHAV